MYPHATSLANGRWFTALLGVAGDLLGVVEPHHPSGYSLPDRDIFRKRAADNDWGFIFPMFRRQVGS